MKLSEEFLFRAKQLGHDISALELGEEAVTFFTLPSLEEGRRLCSMATAEQRAERQKTFFHHDIAIRSRLGQGVHDRCEAFAFADQELSASDRAGLEPHLPLHVKGVSMAQKIVHENEIWNVSSDGAAWGLQPGQEEIYCFVNVDELILKPGARIVVEGNIFSLLVQRIITEGNEPADHHICILPTPYPVDFRHGPIDGYAGAKGNDGKNGNDGVHPSMGSSMLGNYLNGSYVPEDFDGKNGEDGQPGAAGGDGRHGGMCKPAEITLRSVTGALRVFVQAGKGGDGGNGGDGGKGGDAGKGTESLKLISGVQPGGKGGDGGNGGEGGAGGNGGHGGIASNIYINVNAEDEDKLCVKSLPSEGGKRGKGGLSGIGGLAGQGGMGFIMGTNGNNGNPGLSGKDGLQGRGRPAAVVFLNEKVFRSPAP